MGAVALCTWEHRERQGAAPAARYATERELGPDRMNTHRSARLLQLILALSLLAALLPVALRAQCADGTPPPCDAAVRRPAVVTRNDPPAQDVRARSFLVLPFRNVRAIPEDDWLALAPVMLGEALSRWQEVSVVSDERLRLAQRRHGLAPEEAMDEEQIRRVAEETGGWTVVTGDVLRLGNRIRVTARAYDVATSRTVVRVSEDGESEDAILELYERIAAELLETAGVDASQVDVSSVSTESLDALKAYLRGLRHYNRAEMRRAREAFEEAVELDSTFAQAYLKLAQASLLFADLGALSDATHAGYGHLGRAVALSDRLAPRHQRFLRAMDALYHAQFATAREQLEDLLAADSSDVDALLALAWLESIDGIVHSVDGVMRMRGSFHRANSLAKTAVLLDPSQYAGYMILVVNYLKAGGWYMGLVVAARRESASLPAYIESLPANNLPFIAVLRDTLEVIPLNIRDFLAGSYRSGASQSSVRRQNLGRKMVGRHSLGGGSPSVGGAGARAGGVLRQGTQRTRDCGFPRRGNRV